jgi:amidohydrolase
MVFLSLKFLETSTKIFSDALPEIGHACGHNLIATSSLASAVGVSAAMRQLQTPGTLILMGTPAEETGGGKDIMAKNGAWKGVSACIMTHPMNYSTPLFLMKASLKFRAKFYGKASHAAGAPEEGRNACDAIVMAYNGLAMLRQHIKKNESIQSVILEAGKAPNVIPEFAEGSYSIRGKNKQALDALKERVVPIFDGAAASTGCKVEMIW